MFNPTHCSHNLHTQSRLNPSNRHWVWLPVQKGQTLPPNASAPLPALPNPPMHQSTCHPTIVQRTTRSWPSSGTSAGAAVRSSRSLVPLRRKAQAPMVDGGWNSRVTGKHREAGATDGTFASDDDDDDYSWFRWMGCDTHGTHKYFNYVVSAGKAIHHVTVRLGSFV